MPKDKYRGQELPDEEIEALRDLELLVEAPIPRSALKYFYPGVGYEIEDGHVTALRIWSVQYRSGRKV